MKEESTKSERRDFLKAAGAAVAVGFPGIIRAQTVTNAIKVGLVGCGGRGSGAASQALAADDYAELTAVADIDQAQIDNCLRQLKRIQKSAARVKVDSARAVPRPGCVSEGDRQQAGRGAAGNASRVPPGAPGGLHRGQQARLLREAHRAPTRSASARSCRPRRRPRPRI